MRPLRGLAMAITWLAHLRSVVQKRGSGSWLQCLQTINWGRLTWNGFAVKSPVLNLRLSRIQSKRSREADAVYTDVWASMGQEGEREQRMRDFAAYQVNAALMAEAPERAIFMHCMPAHRGQEVTADVIDGPQSVVFRQAANRMHVQKGVLAWLLGPDP